jgi:hypothetical protein
MSRWFAFLMLISPPAWADEWVLLIDGVRKHSYDVVGACQIDRESEKIVRPDKKAECRRAQEAKK